jgi:hypothetical protein
MRRRRGATTFDTTTPAGKALSITTLGLTLINVWMGHGQALADKTNPEPIF